MEIMEWKCYIHLSDLYICIYINFHSIVSIYKILQLLERFSKDDATSRRRKNGVQMA